MRNNGHVRSLQVSQRQITVIEQLKRNIAFKGINEVRFEGKVVIVKKPEAFLKFFQKFDTTDSQMFSFLKLNSHGNNIQK